MAQVLPAQNPLAPEKAVRLRHRWCSIAVVALVLRLLIITAGHTYRITPRGDHFQFGWEMGRIARALALGQGFSNPVDLPTGATAWAAPVYPLLLGGVFRMFGIYTPGSAWVILALNSLFAALNCVVIYRIGERAFGTLTARWSAWAWAVFPYFLYWSIRVVWETTLSALLLSLAVLQALRIVERPDLRRWVVLGLIFGTAALTNPTLAILLPFSIAWIWFRVGGSPRQLTRTVLAALIFAIVCTPWTLRNYRTLGHLMFIRDNFGLELEVANNPKSEGYWTRSEHPGNSPEQMRRMRDIGEWAYMQEKQREAVAFIREHPGEFTRYVLQRAVFFWIGNPQVTLAGGWNMGPARHTAFLLSMLLALAGLWLAFRHRRFGAGLFALTLLVYPLPYYVAHPSPRYRHAIEPVMAVLVCYLFACCRGISLQWKSWRPRVL